ncbi:MAG: acetyl-CoA acetyltransferase [Deltaproteobacteria bacterium]|nr:acetyl-CoA acetyltransferase [Deltaproteobacteria bacterium]
MGIDPERTPVVVGVGQAIEREAVVGVLDLAERAVRAAAQDAPGLLERSQRLSFVVPSFSRASRRPASELAEQIGLGGIACEVSTAGGNSPQWLMNRACAEIAAGRLETTLLVGAEATRSLRLAEPGADFLRVAAVDTGPEAGPDDPVVGTPLHGLLEPPEIKARLIRPADLYPVFESAMAARAGAKPADWRRHLAGFLSRGSQVAAGNPFAWFREPLSPDAIATPGPDNRLTAEPYTKRMNSFAQVDLGSALLVTTLARASALGLRDHCVFPWAGATNLDVAPARRPDLAASPAIRAAARATFEAAGVGLDDVDYLDLYSCFPIAVEVGAAEIGLALDDRRGLTQTGGMSFFGGPGNNYTSHGIAAVVLRLRERGRLGYVSGNGGYLSKHSIGLYAAAPREAGSAFVLADTSKAQAEIEAAARRVTLEAEGRARVDGSSVIYGRDGSVEAAPIIATLEDGRRVVARAEDERLAGCAGRFLVGETVEIRGASPPTYR